MIPLTYETLITCKPFFYSNILAGWNGKKNPCRHVFLNEPPAENDSLLLVHHVDENLALLETSLKSQNTSGIIVIAENYAPIAPSITDLANQLGKPLLFLTNHEGAEIAKKANQILYFYQNNLLELLTNDLTVYWLELYNEHGIKQVIQRLNILMGQEVFFFTSDKKFEPLGPTLSAIQDLKELKTSANDSSGLKQHVSIVQNENNEFFLYTIFDQGNRIIGYFLFEKIIRNAENQIHLLDSITPAIITWSKQLELTRNAHLKYKDQFMFDILNNRIETENELFELGKLWHMEFLPNARVLAINLQSSKPITKDIQLTIQNLLTEADTTEMNIHTTYFSHRIVAIIIPAMMNIKIKDELNFLIREVQRQISEMFPFIRTIAGVGRSYYSNSDIYKSFQEAKIALQMHSYVAATEDGIIHYEDIGYVRLLSYIHDDLLNDFADLYLGDLEKHDRENETHLVHTLYTFCNHNGDIAQTAQNLFIHQNTLRQRLKKIEAILNIQLHRYTDLVNLIISLKISQDMNN